MAPKYPDLLVFITLCNSSLGHSDLLLMNRIWKRWWYITSTIMLQRACGFLLAHPLLLVHSEERQLTYSELPCGEAYDKELQEACSEQMMGT